MSDESFTAVAKTALGVVLIRAHESCRADRLFYDPYAEAFAAAAPEAFAKEQADPGQLRSLGALFGFHVVIRTRFFDDYLLDACASGCRQVVLLGAGLDARAFRLDWPPGVHLFELDLPEMFAFKERVLAEQRAVPGCERTILPVDLRENWHLRLTEAGLDSTEPTAWLSEGLLVYLTACEVTGLLEAIGRLSAPGSQLSFEKSTISESTMRIIAPSTQATEEFLSLWHGGLGEDTTRWLTSHGWRVQTHNRTAVAASYGRPDYKDFGAGFVTAVYE